MRARPRRGDVFWVALDPAKGAEIRKTRPAVIVANDSCNAFGARVVVLPGRATSARCSPERRASILAESRRACSGIRFVRSTSRACVLESNDSQSAKWSRSKRPCESRWIFIPDNFMPLEPGPSAARGQHLLEKTSDRAARHRIRRT